MRNLYLKRYASGEKLISRPPAKNLGFIVTIPSYKEEHLEYALKSLNECTKPSSAVEVIVIINYPDNASEEVKNISDKEYLRISNVVSSWNSSQIQYHIIKKSLSSKHAGVGLARKIAMDEAVRRFEEVENENGIITAFDADCTCEKNYFTALEKYFKLNPKSTGCSIYFEHHKNNSFDNKIFQAVYEYELHLRCYIDALRFCKVPHAFQTIGSSMAVKHKAYQQQGGMNKRKAGEDFYFLHRIIPLGNFGDLTTTTVYPSIRPSDRVPFGTGKAVNKWLQENTQYTYNPESYIPLKNFINMVEEFYNKENNQVDLLLNKLSRPIQEFLLKVDFKKELERINEQSSSKKLFIKHFYQWFNGFMVMKYLHFVREYFFDMSPVFPAAKEIKSWFDPSSSNLDILDWYRNHDRENPHYINA